MNVGFLAWGIETWVQCSIQSLPALEIPNVLRHGSAPCLWGEEEGDGRHDHQAAEDRDGQPGVHLAAEVHHERRQRRSELTK